MPCFTIIPARADLPSASLYTRISTPHSHDAGQVDPNFETVVFIHPLWTDSFFFYPQYEDPVFAEHFNLVAFDIRGHGMTTSELPASHSFSWKDVAEDIGAALKALSINRAHFVGVGSSTSAAAHLPTILSDPPLSISLVAPGPRGESSAEAQVYDELLQTLDVAVRDQDADSLEHIVVSMFDFHLDYQQAPQLRGVRDEYITMAKDNLATGQLYSAARLIRSLIETRRSQPSMDDLKPLRCPLLILSEQSEDTPVYNEYEDLVSTINFNRTVTRPLAMQQFIAGPKWLTLASPNLVNPVLSSFLSTSPNQPLTPVTSSHLGSPRPVSRRPSTPREYTSFSIPPLQPTKLGVMTIGDMLDMQAKQRQEEGALTKSASVVNMTVEVVVRVDTADQEEPYIVEA